MMPTLPAIFPVNVAGTSARLPRVKGVIWHDTVKSPQGHRATEFR